MRVEDLQYQKGKRLGNEVGLLTERETPTINCSPGSERSFDKRCSPSFFFFPFKRWSGVH